VSKLDIQQAQLEAMKKEILRKILSKDALERLGRVKLANPILALQLETYLVQLYQTGQLKEIVTDEKLKQILNMLVEKKEWKIKRV
jgi:programmed cell death protein 5